MENLAAGSYLEPMPSQNSCNSKTLQMLAVKTTQWLALQMRGGGALGIPLPKVFKSFKGHLAENARLLFKLLMD